MRVLVVKIPQAKVCHKTLLSMGYAKDGKVDMEDAVTPPQQQLAHL